MSGMTLSEQKKIHEITRRLDNFISPVLRLQAILQFSQIVDMLAIGDTIGGREQELLQENDKLLEEINHLKGEA